MTPSAAASIHKQLALLFCATLAGASVSAQDPGPIFAGVGRVWTNGSVSALTGIPGGGVTPVIAGDDDSSLPGLFAAIGSLGAGHALGVGHEGLLGDTANRAFDTLRFNRQAIAWLDQGNTRQVGVLSGHGEWQQLGGMGVLRSDLAGQGYQVVDLPGRVTSASLAGKGVLLVGNAWNAFTGTELSLLESFVRSGGGLYLCGVGWSWEAYRTGGLDAYPMNVLGRRFGLTWLSSGIHDPTNQSSGSPVFSRLYPNCNLYLPDTALSHLQSLLGQHPRDLDTHLRADASARVDFLIAVGQVAIALAQLPEAGGVRSGFDATVRGLLQQHATWFGMARRYDPTRDAALANARAVLHGNLVAAFDLTPARIQAITPALDIAAVHPDYLYLLGTHQVLLLDNRSLDAAQRRSLRELFDAVAGPPKPMRRMTVRSTWGTTTPDLASALAGAGVNIFGVGLGAMENGFPSDVPALRRPVFTIVAAHEVTHSIDAAMSGSTTWRATRDRLLQDAGLDDLQYLRSMVGGAFFQNAPQEFVASMANQWVMDSAHTLRIGMTRMQVRKGEPLLQALFMLDLYGQGGSSAPLYGTDTQGRVAIIQAAIGRDSAGRPVTIQSRDATLRLSYDSRGKISKASAALAYGESPGPLGVELGAAAAPHLGNGSYAFVGTAPEPNRAGVLILGSHPADSPPPSPLIAGRMLVDLSTAVVLPIHSDSASTIGLPVPIPYLPALLNTRLYAQALMQRSNPNGADVVGVSRGLELWIGPW